MLGWAHGSPTTTISLYQAHCLITESHRSDIFNGVGGSTVRTSTNREHRNRIVAYECTRVPPKGREEVLDNCLQSVPINVFQIVLFSFQFVLSLGLEHVTIPLGRKVVSSRSRNLARHFVVVSWLIWGVSSLHRCWSWFFFVPFLVTFGCCENLAHMGIMLNR